MWEVHLAHLSCESYDLGFCLMIAVCQGPEVDVVL
jgi:hypothetical protein